MRITPAVWIEKPATGALTANARIAPTAVRKIDVPIVTSPVYPGLKAGNDASGLRRYLRTAIGGKYGRCRQGPLV
jgi:hypothetical protein